MKSIFTLLIIITITGSISLAQKKSDETALAAAVEQLRIAMVAGDSAGLAQMAAEELSYGHSGGHVENKSEFIQKIVSGKSDFVSIELSNQTIKVVGNAGIVRHDLAAATNDKGKEPGNINLHILSVWQKQGGKWKMLARQAVKLNVKN